MRPLVDKAELLARLEPMMTAAGMARVYPETPDRTAHAASLALAGLPHYDDLWAGDMGNVIALVAVCWRNAKTKAVSRRNMSSFSSRVGNIRTAVPGAGPQSADSAASIMKTMVFPAPVGARTTVTGRVAPVATNSRLA